MAQSGPIVEKPYDFYEREEEDAYEWLRHFINCAIANQQDNQRKLDVVPLFLKGPARAWFNEIAANIVEWHHANGRLYFT